MEIPFIGSIWFLLKLAITFALFIYILFAFVIYKQVNLMTETLEVGLEKTVKGISVLHLLLAVGIFILAILVL